MAGKFRAEEKVQGEEDDFFDFVSRELDGAVDFPAPGDLAQALVPATVQTPALELIDQELVAALKQSEAGFSPRLMIFMPPQEGKSERASHFFPLWLLMHNHDLRIGIVSYDKSTAERWGRDIRNDINNFDGSDGQLDLGLRLRMGSKSAGRWQLDGHRGGVYCVGIDGALTGRAVDVLIVDDPVKNRADADSKLIRQQAKDFWTSTARTRFGPNTIIVIIQTRWHEDDLSGWLLEEAKRPGMPPWRIVNIPAKAEKTEDQYGNPIPNMLPDSLGREIGEYLISARGRDREMWEQTENEVGSRDWAALYQQRPAPETGNIFLRKWWRYYEHPRAIRQPDGSYRALAPGRLIQSWDCAFKDTDQSDFVVGGVWHQNGYEVTLLDMIAIRADVVGTCQAMLELSMKWPQAHLKLVEDKANGPAVISVMRKKIGGIVEYQPKGSKLARAYAVAPFCEAGNVFLPSPSMAPWISEYVTQMASFPNAANDDMVDMTTQALSRMLLEANPVTNYMQSLLRERGVTTLPGGRDGGTRPLPPSFHH